MVFKILHVRANTLSNSVVSKKIAVEGNENRKELSETNAFTCRLSGLTDSITSLSSETNIPGGCLIHRSQHTSLRTPYRYSYGKGKQVTFDSVDIHIHHMEMGDNPSVTTGIPVTIGWKAVDRTTMSIDEFEKKSDIPRSKEEFRLPKFIRDQIAVADGNSFDDMRETLMLVKKIQESRLRSSRDGTLSQFLRNMLAKKQPEIGMLPV